MKYASILQKAGFFNIVAMSLVSCGCSALTANDRSVLTSMRTDIRSIEERVVRIEGRIEAMEVQQRDLREEFDRQDSGSQKQNSEISGRMREMDDRIAEVNSARAADKKEIVEQLSKKIETIINKTRDTGRQGSGMAYEHVVQPGESLSRIAATYGVKVDVIVKENNLSDASVIRVGQKLYIPR
jgi:LysM repeat protein